jgi:hypothetical protein
MRFRDPIRPRSIRWKEIVMLRSLLIGVCLAASLAACTSAPTTRADAKDAARVAETQRTSCLKETGTRLPPPPGQCAAFGRSYSSEEMDRTGRTDAGAALQMLDPSITSHH